MGQMITKFALGFVVALSAVVVPSAAFAEGAVKVECWGRCDLVNLGQICDSYSAGSAPVAVACDDTSVGYGTNASCGNGTCRPYGTLYRSDLLAAYCDDGPGYDAVVTCRAGSTLLAEPATPKLDDGAGRQDDASKRE
jgi:hypothetical protein